MRKKLFFILLTTIVLIIFSIAIAFAANYENKKILTGTTIDENSNIYTQINNVNNSDVEYNLDILNKLNININPKARSNNITYYENKLDSREEATFEIDGKKVRFNAKTGEFLSYVADSKQYEDNMLSEEEVQEVAYRIFSKLELDDYTLVSLYEFDKEIWLAQFAKNYGDLYNLGESIKFSFSPESEEIVTLAKFQIPYANNEISISEDDVRDIVNNFLNLRNEYEVKINIVRPNYFWEENTELHKRINEFRKAYVVELKDNQCTQIYIDCTTGEVIGGDMILGGIKYEK